MEWDYFEDYTKKHAPLTIAFHQEWRSYTMFMGYTLPTESAMSKPYVSRYECEKEAKLAVRQLYDLANRYVTAGDSKSVAKWVAEEYAEIVRSVFSPHKEKLKTCCNCLGKTATYEKINMLVDDCEKELKNAFTSELLDCNEYYKMYTLEYFYDKIEVECVECHRSEENCQVFGQGNVEDMQYKYKGMGKVISELENDLNEHITTFYRKAYAKYTAYIAEIELLLDSLDYEFMQQMTTENKESAITKAIKNLMRQETG